MSYLLDVATLLALLWPDHVHNAKVTAWRQNKHLVLCPIAELGFIRVSTAPTGHFNLAIADARKLLEDFIAKDKPGFIPCDLTAIKGVPAPTSGKTTDWYLANLAHAHKMKLATLDAGITHPAAELIP